MNTLSVEELAEVVDVVCLTMFDIPVGIGPRLHMPAEECIQARVDISGAWQGSVQVRASQKFLCLAASRVFLKEIDEVDRQDCMDTITEMTNMFGGTVKCMLPESCSMGLPTIVTQGDEHSDSAISDDAWHYFDCDDQPMAVAVVETTTGKSQAA